MFLASSSRRERALMHTCLQAGSVGGASTGALPDRCHGRSWWRRMAGRPLSSAATTWPAIGFKGKEQRFSTSTRSADEKASATSDLRAVTSATTASIARPGTRRSALPLPATVVTPNPSWRSAQVHFAASTDTPSWPPRR